VESHETLTTLLSRAPSGRIFIIECAATSWRVRSGEDNYDFVAGLIETQDSLVTSLRTPESKGSRRIGGIDLDGDCLGNRTADLRGVYRGQEIWVRVEEEGFTYNQRRFRSLSAVAYAVTSTRWNGYLFFGLQEGQIGE
jgi:hypothetical protein